MKSAASQRLPCDLLFCNVDHSRWCRKVLAQRLARLHRRIMRRAIPVIVRMQAMSASAQLQDRFRLGKHAATRNFEDGQRSARQVRPDPGKIIVPNPVVINGYAGDGQGQPHFLAAATGAFELGHLGLGHQFTFLCIRSAARARLAPDTVQAMIDRKLPRGLGVSQITDHFADWFFQRTRLGLG